MIGFNVQKTQPAPADPEAAPPTYEKVTEDERKKLEDVRWNLFSIYVEAQYTVKKRLTSFPSPAGMSLTKHSLAGNN